VLGFILSVLCSIMTVGGLFNDANFGSILGTFFVFCLASVPFSMFIASFFSSSQLAEQASLAVCLLFYALPIILIFANGELTAGSLSPASAIALMSLVPPMALQVACLSYGDTFLWPEDYPATSSICGMMFVDIFLYLALAWYVNQVVPSPTGISKPWYFVFQPSYWRGKVAPVTLEPNKVTELLTTPYHTLPHLTHHTTPHHTHF